MKTVLLYFSELTGRFYNSDRSDKKEISNFSDAMVCFMEFHKRKFEFFVSRKEAGGKIWFRFSLEVFIENEKGDFLPCKLPDELNANILQ